MHVSHMEKAENLIESDENKISDNANKLDTVDIIENMDKLKDIFLPWTEDIKKTIARLKSFNDLPIKIDYKDKQETNNLPKTLDMWPKPFWNKRKNIDWKTIEKPEYLLMCLNNRKFKINPDVWKIDNVIIKEWSVILELKVWFLWKDETYNSERMTKLLLLLRTHTSGYNKDIPWTMLATVKEIK